MERIERIGNNVVDAAVKLHQRIGPGLFESVYEVLLARQLQLRGLNVERQKAIDIAVVVVEVKSVERFMPAHWKQVLTYLRLLDLRLGFLLNFGCATMREGLRRIVNGHEGRFAPSRLRAKTMDVSKPPDRHPPGSSMRMM